MEKMWDHIFCNELGVPAADHPVLLSEYPPFDGPQERREEREQSAQILFEKFGTPAAYWAAQPVLALQAYGQRRTGVVLDIGHQTTQAIAVREGRIIANSVMSNSDLAGEALLNHTAWLLGEERGISLTTTAERAFLGELMEKRCHVAIDFREEMEKAGETPGGFDESYETPYGGIVNIGNERFRVPEALFQPSLAKQEGFGIHQMM